MNRKGLIWKIWKSSFDRGKDHFEVERRVEFVKFPVIPHKQESKKIAIIRKVVRENSAQASDRKEGD